MLRTFPSLKTQPFRRAVLAAVVALAAAAAFVGASAPVAAHGMHGMFFHPGFGGFHSGFGGFHHGFGGFHHGFHNHFAFGGFGYAPGYAYDDYAGYDACYRRVWGPYGWRLVYVCQ